MDVKRLRRGVRAFSKFEHPDFYVIENDRGINRVLDERFHSNFLLVSGPTATSQIAEKMGEQIISEGKHTVVGHEVVHRAQLSEAERIARLAKEKEAYIMGVGAGKVSVDVGIASNITGEETAIMPTAPTGTYIESKILSIQHDGSRTTEIVGNVIYILNKQRLFESPFGLILRGAGDELAILSAQKDWKLATELGKYVDFPYDASIAEKNAHYPKLIREDLFEIRDRISSGSVMNGDSNLPKLRNHVIDGVVESGVIATEKLAKYGRATTIPFSGDEHHYAHALEDLVSHDLYEESGHGIVVAEGYVLMEAFDGNPEALDIRNALLTNGFSVNIPRRYKVQALLSVPQYEARRGRYGRLRHAAATGKLAEPYVKELVAKFELSLQSPTAPIN